MKYLVQAQILTQAVDLFGPWVKNVNDSERTTRDSQVRKAKRLRRIEVRRNDDVAYQRPVRVV